jgi:hypothetical protein
MQAKGDEARMTDTAAIIADLERRKIENRQYREQIKQNERYVLGLDVDWAEFHNRLYDWADYSEEGIAPDLKGLTLWEAKERLESFSKETQEEFSAQVNERWARSRLSKCSGRGSPHAFDNCWRILDGLGLDERQIRACLHYFHDHGGRCDCTVYFNLDMTEPKPAVDLGCAVCGEDYDEWYMVHDHVWSASGVGKRDRGRLCIGCLEQRLGRKLRPDDFTSAPCNSIGEGKSLRLQSRLLGGQQDRLVTVEGRWMQ